MYKIVIARQALKDFPNLSSVGLDKKVKDLINLIKKNPFQNPPSYEKLVKDMENLYLRRINLKHRLVYEVYEKEKTIKIVSAWSHYENIK